MRNIFFTLLLSISARPLLAQDAPPLVAPDQPYAVEYYYKVRKRRCPFNGRRISLHRAAQKPARSSRPPQPRIAGTTGG